MKLFATLSRRADVMGQMARSLGVDFGERIAHDSESASEYRAAVFRCASCTHEVECLSWMNGHKDAKEAPKYCKNKDLLDRLSPN
ncbi:MULTISPECIES: DUF6455 family protein [Sediminimonas]|uniref:DUF6455 family protein n=1 Tax=Sediminimonas TaxID=659427 RepID=UPI000400351C|nr:MULTISPECIES: DUF6455 family protein [Sediminimonas]MDR9483864.1 DUF6455 family protein [Sediminimonas sp.]